MSEQNTDWLSGLGDFLGGVGDLANDALDGVGGVFEKYDDIFGSSTSPGMPQDNDYSQAPAVSYNPNISASDIFAQPNYTLLFGGLALLIVALFLMKK